MPVHKFSDFSKESNNLPGDKLSFSSVMGKPVQVLQYRLLPSKVSPDKQCVQIQLTVDGKTCVTFTTSGVIIRQLQTYADELPFEAVIERRGKYYTFT